MQRLMLLLIAIFGGLLAIGCAKKDAQPKADSAAAAPALAPTVTGIELGRKLGANNTVAEAATVFGTRDTVYVSVIAQNAVPTSSLTAKWTSQTGQLVDSTTQAIASANATNGATTTEFHISKKSPGKYKVEIWLDGTSVGSRDFEVK